MSSPERGEVWLVDLGYVAKVRPCLVVSIPALNQVELIVLGAGAPRSIPSVLISSSISSQ